MDQPTLDPSPRRTLGSRPGRHLTIGILLFSAALALRLYGLSFGLPYSFSGDETAKRDAALALAETHFVHTDRQPSFLYNSLFVVYAAARSVHRDWTLVDYQYIGRLWIAVLGSLTVVGVWMLGRKFSSRIGLMSALLLCVLPLHTATSRYIKEDAPLGLMVTMTALAAVAYLLQPSRRRLSVVGLAVGCAASTKYTGIVMAAPVALAMVMSRAGRPSPFAGFVGDAAALSASVVAGFFLFSPIYLAHPGLLLDGLRYQGEYAMTGHDGIVIDAWTQWWTYYLRTGLIPGMTWPVIVLALAGLVVLWRRKGGWLVCVSALWIYAILEHALAKPAPFPARYLMPVVPLLCVAAGASMDRLAALLEQRWRPSFVYALFAVLFIAPPLAKSLAISVEALNDTRLIAGQWMDENIPAGSTIVITESLENLPASAFWERRWQVVNRDGPALSTSWEGPPPYFVVSSFKYQRFLDSPESVPARTAFYRTAMTDFSLIKEFQPHVLTYGKHSPVIRIYRPGPRPETAPNQGASSSSLR